MTTIIVCFWTNFCDRTTYSKNESNLAESADLPNKMALMVLIILYRSSSTDIKFVSVCFARRAKTTLTNGPARICKGWKNHRLSGHLVSTLFPQGGKTKILLIFPFLSYTKITLFARSCLCLPPNDLWVHLGRMLMKAWFGKQGHHHHLLVKL